MEQTNLQSLFAQQVKMVQQQLKDYVEACIISNSMLNLLLFGPMAAICLAESYTAFLDSFKQPAA
jgi:hypothetical protein